MRDRSRYPAPQVGDIINQPGHPFDGFAVISVYTRAQAIADGVLIDATRGELTEVSAQHFPGVHVAMTAAVGALIEKAVASKHHANDWKGVWHDVLWMSNVPPIPIVPSQRVFQVIVQGAGKRGPHTFKVVAHPGDRGEPCLTIMLPNED
jgi:hypothetical protein